MVGDHIRRARTGVGRRCRSGLERDLLGKMVLRRMAVMKRTPNRGNQS